MGCGPGRGAALLQQCGLVVVRLDSEGWQTDPSHGSPRWLAHHRLDSLSARLTDAGFVTQTEQRRSAHRDWLTVQACKR